MFLRSITFSFALLIASNFSRADDPVSQDTWIKSSGGGTAVFKMISPEWDYSGRPHKLIRKPHGIAYTMDPKGKLAKQWETTDWYAYEGFISDNGRYFVSLDRSPTDQEHHTDVAIAFYDQGKLLKQYRVCDLIKKPDTLVNSVMYYKWRPFRQSFPDRLSGHTFWLTMVDKTRYAFDAENGNIIQTEYDSLARNFAEVSKERDVEAARRGFMLYENSSLKKRFEKYFRLEKASSDKRRSTHGINFKEPEWCATFNPIADYRYPCIIETIFPVMPLEGVHTEISAEDIDLAIRETFAHPAFQKRFSKTSIINIEMKISGNSLHMMHGKAHRHLPEAGVDIHATPIEKWAHFVVEHSGREITTVYYNIESKQIVFIEYP